MNANNLLLILHGLMLPILVAAFLMLILPVYAEVAFIILMLCLMLGNGLLAVYWFFSKEG